MGRALAKRFPFLRLASIRILRRFARNKRGTVAVEFSMIGVPFLGLMTAILQTGIVSLESVQLTNATYKAARSLRTVQANTVGSSYINFTQNFLCNNLQTAMIKCANIQIQVTVLAAGNSANWSSIATTVTNSGFYSSTYSATGGLGNSSTIPALSQGSIGVLQAIYPLPPVIAILSGSTLTGSGGISNASGATANIGGQNVYLIYAASAFTVE